MILITKSSDIFHPIHIDESNNKNKNKPTPQKIKTSFDDFIGVQYNVPIFDPTGFKL